MTDLDSRRIAVPFIALATLLIVSSLVAGCSNQVLSLVGRQVVANMQANPVADLPDGLHVLVCGAGMEKILKYFSII